MGRPGKLGCRNELVVNQYGEGRSIRSIAQETGVEHSSVLRLVRRQMETMAPQERSIIRGLCRSKSLSEAAKSTGTTNQILKAWLRYIGVGSKWKEVSPELWSVIRALLEGQPIHQVAVNQGRPVKALRSTFRNIGLQGLEKNPVIIRRQVSALRRAGYKDESIKDALGLTIEEGRRYLGRGK